MLRALPPLSQYTHTCVSCTAGGLLPTAPPQRMMGYIWRQTGRPLGCVTSLGRRRNLNDHGLVIATLIKGGKLTPLFQPCCKLSLCALTFFLSSVQLLRTLRVGKSHTQWVGCLSRTTGTWEEQLVWHRFQVQLHLTVVPQNLSFK